MKKNFILMIKKILFPFSLILFFCELVLYKFFKIRNSNKSYQTMIKLFLLSGGWSNGLIHNLLKKKSIKDLRDNKLNLILNNYEKNGFHLEENFLTLSETANFKKQINQLEGYWFGDKIEEKKKEIFNRNKIKSVKFYYEANDLIKLDFVKKLIKDENILDLARTTLGCEPILSNLACWWSFPSDLPDKKSAQWWHFDMDSPKWVKLFFYLEDCNEKNGPHIFIRGSHKDKGIPYSLRKKGYSRLEDEEINKFYSENDIIEFKCKEGSLLIENSRGLHKGKKLIEGSRLMFNLEYSSSLFGDVSEIHVNHHVIKELNTIKQKQYIFQNLK